MQNSQREAQSPHRVILDIPARYQWENQNGYCGQACIQSCALYYGNYLSQQAVRAIAGSEVLLGKNAQKTLQRLGFTVETWNSKSAQPQYKNYLQWIKKNIAQGYPVIITGYQPQGKYPEYDHIYLAVGVDSQNYEQFSNDDLLIYADMFDDQYTYTPFGKVWDNRAMKHNGSKLVFAIQEQINYGIAVKGIKDIGQRFLPIRMELEENSEPNVTVGEESVDFQLKVRVSGLKAGVKYVILSYEDYKKLPTEHIEVGKSDKVTKFTATGPVYDLVVICDSSSTLFFRCIQQKHLQ